MQSTTLPLQMNTTQEISGNSKPPLSLLLLLFLHYSWGYAHCMFCLTDVRILGVIKIINSLGALWQPLRCWSIMGKEEGELVLCREDLEAVYHSTPWDPLLPARPELLTFPRPLRTHQSTCSTSCFNCGSRERSKTIKCHLKCTSELSEWMLAWSVRKDGFKRAVSLLVV